jgi:carboxyl-terminal processing protease
MDKQKELLAKNDYPFREFNLGVPPVKKTVEKKKTTDGDDDDSELSSLTDDGYGKFDPHLRETLRVLSDAVDLGRKPQGWAGDHAPLTAQVATKG